MRRDSLTFFLFLCTCISFGQQRNKQIICSSDTLVVMPHQSMKQAREKTDSIHNDTYKIIRCVTCSNVAFRFEVGISNYYYGPKTESWIGQHGGPNFNFILTIDKLNFGMRFKPWSVDPKKEMDFNGKTVPIIARLNVIKLDYYVGYSVDFKWLFSVEPYLGYNRSSFVVINEDELKQKYTFKKSGGLILGMTLNKYFKIKEYEYISVFGTLGYGLVNYKKIHPDLDNGYLEWNLGIAYKGFFVKRFNKKI